MLKPSELAARLTGTMGMPNAMGRAETEQAAALLIHYCAAHGDKWQLVKYPSMRQFIIGNAEKEEWRVLKNPFFRPDFPALQLTPYARHNGDALELTAFGIMKCAVSLQVPVTFYAITHKTKDYGDKYVVRKHYITPGKGDHCDQDPVAVKTELEEARTFIPVDCMRLPLTPYDDPVIVESWF